MQIKEVASLLNAEIISGQKYQNKFIETAFSSDLMSDVLTVKTDGLLLLTGLANIQTIRTAEMSDIGCLVFVRNKQVTEEMRMLAEENKIVLVCTPYSLFRASGILYNAGIRPVF